MGWGRLGGSEDGEPSHFTASMAALSEDGRDACPAERVFCTPILRGLCRSVLPHCWTPEVHSTERRGARRPGLSLQNVTENTGRAGAAMALPALCWRLHFKLQSCFLAPVLGSLPPLRS